MPNRKLLVIANEAPYPPNHGGRVDQWSRDQWLKSQGWSLDLVAWFAKPAAPPTAQDIVHMRAVFDEVFFFDCGLSYEGLARRLVYLFEESPHISSRRLRKRDRVILDDRLKAARPDAIFLDGLYGGVLAFDIAQSLAIPVIYRSHNLEYRYMAGQSRAAHSILRKIKLGLASLHLENFEAKVHREAAIVFDISLEDLRHWHERRFCNHIWLPPIVNAQVLESAPKVPWGERDYDIVFMGNLRTPNNVEGLHWFIDKVLPHLRRSDPDVKILVAGAEPSDALRQKVTSLANVTLLANPKVAVNIRGQARVLINPVLSGSGTNLKNVEALFTDSPIVTTSVGAAGFAEQHKQAFVICDDPSEFANAILACLTSDAVSNKARQAVRDVFSREAGAWLIDGLTRAIETNSPTDWTGSVVAAEAVGNRGE